MFERILVRMSHNVEHRALIKWPAAAAAATRGGNLTVLYEFECECASKQKWFLILSHIICCMSLLAGTNTQCIFNSWTKWIGTHFHFCLYTRMYFFLLVGYISRMNVHVHVHMVNENRCAPRRALNTPIHRFDGRKWKFFFPIACRGIFSSPRSISYAFIRGKLWRFMQCIRCFFFPSVILPLECDATTTNVYPNGSIMESFFCRWVIGRKVSRLAEWRRLNKRKPMCLMAYSSAQNAEFFAGEFKFDCFNDAIDFNEEF